MAYLDPKVWQRLARLPNRRAIRAANPMDPEQFGPDTQVQDNAYHKFPAMISKSRVSE
jgi:hypothetical protein